MHAAPWSAHFEDRYRISHQTRAKQHAQMGKEFWICEEVMGVGETLPWRQVIMEDCDDARVHGHRKPKDNPFFGGAQGVAG